MLRNNPSMPALLASGGMAYRRQRRRQRPVYGYTIRNRRGRVQYVGTTNNPRRRAAQHRKAGKRGRLKVQSKHRSRRAARQWERKRLASHRRRNRGRNPRIQQDTIRISDLTVRPKHDPNTRPRSQSPSPHQLHNHQPHARHLHPNKRKRTGAHQWRMEPNHRLRIRRPTTVLPRRCHLQGHLPPLGANCETTKSTRPPTGSSSRTLTTLSRRRCSSARLIRIRSK